MDTSASTSQSAETSKPADGTAAPRAPETEAHYHEDGALFRHLSSDLKLSNPAPEAFSDASPEERAHIQTQMNALLARSRARDEMFPDSKLTYSLGRHYFKVHSDEIDAVFPEADKDWRALLLRFTQLFRSSYVWKILIKRLLVGGAIPVYFLFVCFAKKIDTAQLGLGDGLSTTILVYAAAGFVVLILFSFLTGILDERFTRALQSSCTAISQNTLQRLAALGACVDNIQIAIRDLYDQEEGKWTKQSNYLMALTIWLPLRVLHIERYFQLTMWRVHREFVYIQYLALALQAVIFLAAIGITLELDPAFFVGGKTGVAIFIAATAIFMVLSFMGKSTSVAFVHENLPIDQWSTFGVLRMDTVISRIVVFLIKKFIMLRDVGRPNK